MGKKLAIRGHSTRGKEVIKLLEMMGGSNIHQYNGEANSYSYYISGNVILNDRLSIIEDDDFEIFTLQEFLEKFPFKIHDLVNIPEYESTVGICGMRWDPYSKHMEYMVYRCDDEEWYTAEELLDYNDNPNKKENMEEKDKAKAPKLKGEDYSGKRYGYKIPDGYEFDTIVNGKIIIRPIKPKYPTTYKECEKILGLEDSIIEGCLGYEYKLLNDFQKLLMCRDAYWNIAGEQMGLDGPWKADFRQGFGIKYIILFANGEVIWNRQECETVTGSRVLAFPTAEMRDAFYNNFKNLINQCKELL